MRDEDTLVVTRELFTHASHNEGSSVFSWQPAVHLHGAGLIGGRLILPCLTRMLGETAHVY